MACVACDRAWFYCKACHEDIKDETLIKKCKCKNCEYLYITLQALYSCISCRILYLHNLSSVRTFSVSISFRYVQFCLFSTNIICNRTQTLGMSWLSVFLVTFRKRYLKSVISTYVIFKVYFINISQLDELLLTMLLWNIFRSTEIQNWFFFILFFTI